MRSAPSTFSLLLQLGVLVHGAHGAHGADRVAKAMLRHGGPAPEASSGTNVYETEFPGVTWDDDNWILNTTKLEQGQYQSRGSVANGYFGINVASVGPFIEFDTSEKGDLLNGWPTFTRRQTFGTIAGFFDSQAHFNGTNFPWLSQYGHDSGISGVPHWAGIILDLGGDDYLDATVDNETISNFSSAYDFKAGVLSWSYRWTPTGKKGSYCIAYRLFANKLYVNQAVVDMEIISSVDSDAKIVNVIDGVTAVRTDFVESGNDDGAIYSAVRPIGVSNVAAYVFANLTGSGGVDLSRRELVTNRPYLHANESSIAQSVPVSFSAGRVVRVTKYVGAASSDAFAEPKQTARQACSAALANGYAKSLLSHVREWASVMPDDSVDSYALPKTGALPVDSFIINSAIIAVTNTYYLVQTTVGKNAIKAVDGAPVNVDSISVGGLSSDSYAGLVFWDADLWMQPGLVASHPDAAQRITNYRLAKFGQAQANIKTAFAGSQNKTNFSPSAAVYPWASGRYGNCTATGPCWDYQYHLNGDIGLSFINQWVASGDTELFKEKLFPIYDSVAQLYADMLKPNGSSWTLTNMTETDEFANSVDAGGFTMPLMAETLTHANDFRKQFGLPENETWAEMAANVLTIRENGVTLEFTTMNGSASVKQADVILVTYPLSYTANYTAQDSLKDLDYYANKQSPDGPAMTYAFFSIVANQVSPSGCSAYTYAQYSFQPFVRAPFYQISEQVIDDFKLNSGTHAAYPFLTGHGGANQVVLFGYLGLRMLPDDFLHVDPNLPPQMPYLRYRTFYWRGWPISAWSNYTHTTIARATNTPPLDGADKRFADRAIIIHSGAQASVAAYQLPIHGSVVVPNRQVASVDTAAGNLIQCQPVRSSDPFIPGQFPMGAVDGATSTKWQPSLAANWSAITVSLAEQEASSLVSGFQFNWAQAPPVNATVIFHDKILSDPSTAFLSSAHRSDFTVVASLENIKQSNPFDAATTNLNAIAIPLGNTTNVTLSSPIPATRFASLLIIGSQASSAVELRERNGTGATVAEWVIVGHGKGKAQHSGSGSGTRRSLNLRAAAMMADLGRPRHGA